MLKEQGAINKHYRRLDIYSFKRLEMALEYDQSKYKRYVAE